VDAVALARRDFAAGENIDRHVHRHRAWVKQIERPEIKRGTSEIGTARRLGEDFVAVLRW